MLPSRLSEALARLATAATRLQAAAEQQARADAGFSDRDAEFALLQEDRNRLAAELDAALADGERLAILGDEVGRRLDAVEATVSATLAELAPAPGGR